MQSGTNKFHLFSPLFQLHILRVQHNMFVGIKSTIARTFKFWTGIGDYKCTVFRIEYDLSWWGDRFSQDKLTTEMFDRLLRFVLTKIEHFPQRLQD